MKNHLFENEIIKFELEDSILLSTLKVELLDLNIAKTITDNRLKAQNGVNYPLLSNVKSLKGISKETRDYMASKEGCAGVLAAAVIIDSPVTSMIGNFFINISKPLVPTKMFTDEEKAKKWLKMQM